MKQVTNVIPTDRNKFRVETYYVVLNELKSASLKRQNAYDIVDKFSVFNNLSLSSAETIIERSEKLISLYGNDLTKSFLNECTLLWPSE